MLNNKTKLKPINHMKVTVSTYKQSGKWYDTFDIELSNHIKPFDKNLIASTIKDMYPQCTRMDFVYVVDGVPQLVKLEIEEETDQVEALTTLNCLITVDKGARIKLGNLHINIEKVIEGKGKEFSIYRATELKLDYISKMQKRGYEFYKVISIVGILKQ